MSVVLFTSIYISSIISGVFEMRGNTSFFLGINDPHVICFLDQKRKKMQLEKLGYLVYHRNWQGFSGFCQFRAFVHEYLGVVNCAMHHPHNQCYRWISCSAGWSQGPCSLCSWRHSQRSSLWLTLDIVSVESRELWGIICIDTRVIFAHRGRWHFLYTAVLCYLWLLAGS